MAPISGTPMSMGDVVFSCLVSLPLTGISPALRGACACGCRSGLTWMKRWSGRRDSNPRPQPWQGCALPLSYAREFCIVCGVWYAHPFTGLQTSRPSIGSTPTVWVAASFPPEVPALPALERAGLWIRVSWQTPADAECQAYGNRITVNEGNIFNRFFRIIVSDPRLADLAATYSPTS